MGKIEPAGLPAVRLAPLRRLRARDELSDEDMVNVQRVNLLDPTAPNPSVETLLHAFLPHKFVDHTHVDRRAELIDQPNSEELCREIYGGAHGLRALRHAGLSARQESRQVFDANPDVEGLILLQARHLHFRRERARSL